VVVLGEERVGKTSIIKGYCVGGRDVSEQGDSPFDPSEQMTLDACAFLKYEYLGANEDHEMIIDIWDTAGQERYRLLNHAYIRGSQGAIVVYDATDSSSECFKNIKKSVNDLRNYMSSEKPIIIVANKYDLLVK
jgi:small GTP-binding protein